MAPRSISCMSNYSHRSEEDLRYLYEEEGMKQKEIADLLGKSPGTICKWMNRHDIETGNRKWSEVSASEVADLYDEDKSFSEMAHGTKYDAYQIRNASITEGVHDPREHKEIVYEDEELLEQIESAHAEYGFVSKRLFESLDWTSSVSTIRNHFGTWLNGVKRSAVEVSDHQKQGSSTPQTNEPRDYDKPRGSQSLYRNERQKALDRDGYKCAFCDRSRKEDVEELHTHHIEPVSSFDNPNDSHDKENLITLCKDHHNGVHQNNIDCPEPP